MKIGTHCRFRVAFPVGTDPRIGSTNPKAVPGGPTIPERADEQGRRYKCTAGDTAYGTFQLDDGIVAQINSSWSFRVYRDELFSLQVDGSLGSAVAGLHECRTQHRANTPRPVWNPDVENPFRFREQWQPVPDNLTFDNGFKVQWSCSFATLPKAPISA